MIDDISGLRVQFHTLFYSKSYLDGWKVAFS